MQICFIKDGTALTLPVTPAGYAWGVGRNLETINISQLGDVYRPGGRSRFSGEALECLLPAQDYPWMEPGAIANPQYYVDILTAWAAAGEPVRYIVSGTQINTQVYLESVEWRERDGTGDVYASIWMREYTDLEAREVAAADRQCLPPDGRQRFQPILYHRPRRHPVNHLPAVLWEVLGHLLQCTG